MKNRYQGLLFALALTLSGCSMDKVYDHSTQQTVQQTEDNGSTSTTNETDLNNTDTLGIADFGDSKFIGYYESLPCDQTLVKDLKASPDKTDGIAICYSYKHKSALASGYLLDGDLVYKENIQNRPPFRSDENIPEEYRAYYSFYSGSGYDRGHLAPDADFDYDQNDLKLTYLLSNIVPQDPTVNQELWVKAEKYERYMAAKYKKLYVVNFVVFDAAPKHINHGVAIANGFVKAMWNKDKSFEKCYYYDNFVIGDVTKDELEDHAISCSEVSEKIGL